MRGETECVYIQKLIDVVVADSNIHHGGVGVTYLLHTTALPQLVCPDLFLAYVHILFIDHIQLVGRG
jgi:hypothetical protein